MRYVREYARENTERALAQPDRVVEGYHEYVVSAYKKLEMDRIVMKDPHSLVAVAGDKYRRDRG
ncbi:MAG: hypothetical protein MUC88_25505 [Planctomycetes bacterium]|nr:hypothetical protein [Planctomycetota bacterium]